MKVRSHICYLFLIILLAAFQGSYAQPGFKVDIKKPKPYEERLLKAEKTGDGKLKAPKRIMQNLTTRFNYYFNANNKFNEVLDRAKAQHVDDFSQLLSFYNYSLDGTAADSLQLDSIIYKARTGILNHDLRSEWLDELYLLWGASFHLEKKLDSAYLMFQFINYAYAPQDEDGFYKFIGTRTEGAQELSIATKEDKKFLHSNTFSRNNAFIWQIRTLTELENFTAAGSLITTLKRDPAFPKRLDNDLEEAEAYWYYKQQLWDSAAAHLLVAIEGADNKREKARWNYLAAQLMERSGKWDEATKLYAKAISQTPDPVMEVYARLNLVRINKEGGENSVDKNVAELLKMAKRDKYEDYRDIIYYMAAQMEMERGNIGAAQELLIKGSKYNNGNQASRSKAFLQIADVSFDQKKYLQAASFYDSIQVADLAEADSRRVFQRKGPLQKIMLSSGVISRQDSLQRIAALPEAEQKDFVKKLVKQLRKQQGLKEEGVPTAGASPLNNPPTELFSAQQKGEWYFYNTNSKAQGAGEFKQVWGNRPNVDNWRRFAVVSQQLLARNPMNIRGVTDATQPFDFVDNNPTLEGLLSKLPTTPEAVKASNDSIKTALFTLGAVYLNELEDYASAITTYEEIRRRFPNAEREDELLFNLYYAYTKAGNATQAASIKRLLLDKYPSSRYATILSTGKDPQAKKASSPEATKAYENVYNLYIEGKFGEAETAKHIADSTYKTTFWQPQLLYIEAVYNIRQRQDSVAKSVLQTLISQNSNAALTSKAQNLLSVLNRRRQIEDELNRYQIQNQGAADTTTKQPVVPIPLPPAPKKDTVENKPAVQKPVDTLVKKPIIKTPVDTLVKKPVAQKAIDTVKKATAVKKATDTLLKKPTVKKPVDTLAKKPAVKSADSVAKKKVDTLAKGPVVKKPVDTVAKKPVVQQPASVYTYTPDASHYAIIILDKVDPVFVGEARNAFFRFNKEKNYTQSLDVQTLSLTADTKLLVVSSFPTAQGAVDYVQRAKVLAPSEIIPWLTGNKYTFSVISAANLEVLKTAADINAYKKFLNSYLPGKF
ncbi:MAG TPA: tetratricopeptide repeat protein [Flavisolibacter sp.]|nr:tetratricopeptide repeat protein [Flavisolibacter sp.]